MIDGSSPQSTTTSDSASKAASRWGKIASLAAWLTAVLLFLVIEIPRMLERGGLVGWFVNAEFDALIYLAFLAAAPFLYWQRTAVLRSAQNETWWVRFVDGLLSPERSPSRAVVLAAIVGGTSLIASMRVASRFDGLPPAYHDEYSYLFQAETFLAGRTSFPSHEAARLFDQMHVLNEGKFASRYFPGTGAWMAPFVAAGLPYWGHWLAGAMCALLMFFVARELAGDGAGFIAGMVTALAPGMALFSNMLLAHHPTLAGLGWFLWGFVRMVRSGDWRWGFVCGTGLVFAALCRPMTAASIGFPFGIYLIAWWLKNQTYRKERTRAIVALGIPLVAGGTAMFVYDQSITGSGWQTPYGLYTDLHTPRHVYGFNNRIRGDQKQGPRVIQNYDEWAENLTPRLALANAGTRVMASAKWTLGLIPMLFALTAGLVAWRRLPVECRLVLAGIVSLHVAHIPYWFVGMEDHHYVFEAAPLWGVWIGVVTVIVGREWKLSNRGWIGYWWSGLLGTAAVMNFWVSSGTWSAPYEQGIGRVAFARGEHGRFRDLVNRRAVPLPALVLVDSDPADRHIEYVTNHPNLSSAEVLIGHYLPDVISLEKVRELFPDRSVFVYRIRNHFREGRRMTEESWREAD